MFLCAECGKKFKAHKLLKNCETELEASSIEKTKCLLNEKTFTKNWVPIDVSRDQSLLDKKECNRTLTVGLTFSVNTYLIKKNLRKNYSYRYLYQNQMSWTL